MNQETVTAPGEPTVTTRHFSILFPTSGRGAHNARHAAEDWLATQEEWSHATADGDTSATAFLLIAELTANAALHGRVRGRAARLALVLSAATLRIEVTDARGDRLPESAPRADGESGRGLLLVASLADTWGCEPHHPGGKTVWAEVAHTWRESATRR